MRGDERRRAQRYLLDEPAANEAEDDKGHGDQEGRLDRVAEGADDKGAL